MLSWIGWATNGSAPCSSSGGIVGICRCDAVGGGGACGHAGPTAGGHEETGAAGRGEGSGAGAGAGAEGDGPTIHGLGPTGGPLERGGDEGGATGTAPEDGERGGPDDRASGGIGVTIGAPPGATGNGPELRASAAGGVEAGT